jgi:hypothetical protein
VGARGPVVTALKPPPRCGDASSDTPTFPPLLLTRVPMSRSGRECSDALQSVRQEKSPPKRALWIVTMMGCSISAFSDMDRFSPRKKPAKAGRGGCAEFYFPKNSGLRSRIDAMTGRGFSGRASS